MIVESLVKRDGDTIINMGGREYIFTKNKAGDSVCKVDYKEHLDRMLRFGALYREYKPTEPVEEVEVKEVKVEPKVEEPVVDKKKKDLEKLEGKTYVKPRPKKGRPRRA